MPLGKQASARQHQLFEDLKEAVDGISDELPMDEFLQEIANGLWNKGWRHPDRVEIVDPGPAVPGYLESGVPSE